MDQDTRKLRLQACFSKLEHTLSCISVNSSDLTTRAQDTLNEIKQHADDLLQMKSSCNSIGYIQVESLSGWTFLGAGNFGDVFECKLKRSKVAVKILKKGGDEKCRESNLLRNLSHSNIASFRGMGYITKTERSDVISDNVGMSDSQDKLVSMFLVMEFVNNNLQKYVQQMKTLERHGLSDSQTWNIGQQITSALVYLHSENIAHKDLKPENILIEVGPAKFMVKVADFGLANCIAIQSENHQYASSHSYCCTKWNAPELDNGSNKYNFNDYMKADIYSLGLILTFAVTGVKGLPNNLKLQKTVKGPLREAIESCTEKIPDKRPTADVLMTKCFAMEKNPYHGIQKVVEFFSCGFKEKSNIYVADSCIRETQAGFYQTLERPAGYDHKDLVCKIETKNNETKVYPGTRIPKWSEEEKNVYQESYIKHSEKVNGKDIDKNTTAALKMLVLSRPGEDERQRIDLYFQESVYCHHQSMKDIWMALSLQEKDNEVPFKGAVHEFFSNSFDLHVAVLTNERPGKPQKCLFSRRRHGNDMSSLGTYACGTVKSVSKADYVYKDGQHYVNLVSTAARGIGLNGSDLDAICLSTMYLKYDSHEWEMCGFIDLKDERIATEHRFNAASIQSRFTSSPTDEYEHQTLTFVDFELETMVTFVVNNQENIASSAKLVVVKVLQAFFGWETVQKQFEQNA